MDKRTLKNITANIISRGAEYAVIKKIALDLYYAGVPSKKTVAIARRVYTIAAAAAGSTDARVKKDIGCESYAFPGQILTVYNNPIETHKKVDKALRAYTARHQ